MKIQFSMNILIPDANGLLLIGKFDTASVVEGIELSSHSCEVLGATRRCAVRVEAGNLRNLLAKIKR